MITEKEQAIKEQIYKVEGLTVEAITNARKGIEGRHYHYLTAVGYIEMLQDALISLKISIKKELK